MVHDLTGQMIGHYQVMRPIEQGGMATVYLARDIHLQRQVAIKVFQFAPDQERSQEFFYRFTREAQVVARLDHPNIVLVHDYGEQDNLAYLVMPYFAQGSLKQLLQERGSLSIADALRFSAQLLNALQYAHDRGLIHRDIKPGNILFKDKQTAVLADFGLVKETIAGNTEEMVAIDPQGLHQLALTNGAMMGTPYYMAPEQIHGHVQSQSDIYSIGLVLYEMLTGRLPFVKNPTDGLLNVLLKQMNDVPIPITEINPAISSQLEAAIMRALEKDVTRRYQRPGEFLEALSLAFPENMTSVPTRILNVTRAHPGYEKDDQDLDATVPQVSQQDSLPALTVKKDSSSLEHATTDPAQYQTTQHTRPKRRRVYVLYGVLATIVLLALIFASPYLLAYVKPGVLGNLVHSSKTPIAMSQRPSIVATPMPQTQTSCPADGKARAAVLASYGSQGNNVVVYVASAASPGTSTLKSYNPLTGKTSLIITIPSLITDVQLSANGEWIIFVTYDTHPGVVSRLQMVRIDGQGLQTLYCSSSTSTLTHLLVSPGLNPTLPWLMFFTENSTDNNSTLFVLNAPTGGLMQKSAALTSYSPIVWVNNEELYLRKSGEATASDSIVDLIVEPDQVGSEFAFSHEMAISTSCSDVSFSTDNSKLYISQCTGLGDDIGGSDLPPDQGPSTLASTKLDLTAGKWSQANIYYKNPTLAIVQLRAVTSTRLLLEVRNGDTYANQNGLWEMNTDGSDLERLYTDTSESSSLNIFSQYPWSNVSRDGNSYAFKVGSTQSLGDDQLLVGPLSGGVPKVIAQDGKNDLTEFTIVGWTTI